jgi:hypothetical protein
MAKLSKKNIKLGTNSDEINARDISANFSTPASYTPTQIASEGTDKISAHLNGIDLTIGSLGAVTGDIGLTSFNANDNQASAANVTGLSFANGTVRSFVTTLSIVRNSTYAQYTLRGIQKAASWEMIQEYIGDVTGLEFTITTGGQIQYTSSSTGNTATLKFRATITSV